MKKFKILFPVLEVSERERRKFVETNRTIDKLLSHGSSRDLNLIEKLKRKSIKRLKS